MTAAEKRILICVINKVCFIAMLQMIYVILILNSKKQINELGIFKMLLLVCVCVHIHPLSDLLNSVTNNTSFYIVTD